MYRDVPGEVGEQPFHLDGTVPWMDLEGRKCTPLSCIILLTDGPGAVLGRLLSNFWDELDDDEAVSSFLLEQVEESKKKEKSSVVQRAGHVLMFPLGRCFLSTVSLFR